VSNTSAKARMSARVRVGESGGEGLPAIVWRQRWIMMLAVLMGLVGSLIYITRKPCLYRSTSRIYVEQSGPKIITEQEGLMTQSKNYLYTQCELLRSMPILRMVVEDPSIRQMQTFQGKQNAIGYLKGNMQVTVGRKDDIINVSFQGPQPEEAAQIVNAVVGSYIQYNTKHKKSTAGEILKILQKEKDKYEQKLLEKQQAVLKFTRENGTVSFDDNDNNIVMKRLVRLSEALTETQLEIAEAKADYDAFESIMHDPDKVRQFFQVLYQGQDKHPTFSNQDLREESENLQIQLEILRREGTVDHPAVQGLLTQVAQLRRRVSEQENSLVQGYRTNLIQRWVAALKKEAQINESLQNQQQLALEQNAKETEYMTLQSDLQRTEKLCNILDSRIKEINVTEEAGALNISILEKARASGSPSEPRKSRIAGAGVALGLMVGLGLAWWFERKDERFHSLEEITRLLELPILGTVPAMEGKKTPLRMGQKVVLEPAGAEAEAFRSIRTAIYFGVPETEARTILVSSANEGEGKSTLVSNLAITMAQVGQRTLIIDADFRKPSQDSIFPLYASGGWEQGSSRDMIGLREVIAGRARLEQAVQYSGIWGLDVLPLGMSEERYFEMLSSSEFSKLLSECCQRYERILIDSPPILPLSDTRILSGMCDQTILVICQDKSSRTDSEAACEGVLSVGGRILGVVVNEMSGKKERYSYYVDIDYQQGRQAENIVGSRRNKKETNFTNRV